VNRANVGAVVKKFANAHPEGWHFTAASIVIAALQDAFPCK
jgi:hypothetical protein